MAKKREWLRAEHPIYRAWKDIWRKNERRLRGGEEVLQELRRFDWEKKHVNNDEAYKARQADATYINFPDLHATILTGHLQREAPSPDGGSLNFGTLGVVDRDAVTPDRAYDIYYNVDGRGTKGSHWDQWWMQRLKFAQATGHRWIYATAAPVRPRNRQDELDGLRPFLTEFSPLYVTNWDEEGGVFNFIVVKIRTRSARLNEDGEFPNGGKFRSGYLLLVRAGFDGLDNNKEGDKFSEGGWWKFDHDHEMLLDSDGQPLHGTFEATGGEIPMFPFFYEPDDGTDEMPALSRPGLTGLGQVAVSYMNLSSAADYDAWDAGQSITYLVGLPPSAHNEVVAQAQDGSKIIGVPSVTDSEGKTHVPSIADGSQGAVSSTTWEQRLKNKWEEARVLAALEATGDPNTSGVSKQMSFEDIMAPRLANVAANIETAQRRALHYLERLYNPASEPSATVIWPRTFKLRDVVADINAIFAMEALTGYKNPEFGAELIVRAAEELALVSDPKKREELLQKYREAAEKAAENAAALARQLSMGVSGLTDEGEPTEEDEE